MHATNGESLGTHASCVLLLDDTTGRLEACVPSMFEGIVHV
jgi:hypothetical protein